MSDYKDIVDFPASVEIEPNHTGEIGEAIFSAMYEPPEPVTRIISEFCREESPEWVSLEDLRIWSLGDRSNNVTYTINTADSKIRWERDGVISADFSPIGEDRERLEDELGVLNPRGTTNSPSRSKRATGRN